jgi:regulator of protease activity HflC (stomatin/prohibitin superfamily)
MDIFSEHLRQFHADRVYTKTLIGPSTSLLDRLEENGLLQQPRGSLHPLHFVPLIGTFVYLGGRHIVPPGHVGKSIINGNPLFHPPGSYFFHNPLQKFLGIEPIRSNKIKHGHIEIQQIHEHEIGIISDENRTLRLLLPGTHVLNKNEIHLTGVIDMNLNETQSFANVKYFYVEQGHVGLTQKGPSIQEYKPGPHISFDPVETLPTEIKILPQTLRLNPVTLNTAEQLRVTLRPVVYLMISDPGKSLQARRKDNGMLLTLEALIEDQIDVTLGRIFMGINLHDMGHKLQNQQSSGFVKKAYAAAKPTVMITPTVTTDAHKVVLSTEHVSLENNSTSSSDEDGKCLTPVRSFDDRDDQAEVTMKTSDDVTTLNDNNQQAQEGYVETKLASALNIAITTTVHDNFVNQLQEKLNDFGITVRDVGFEEVRFDQTIQGQLDAYAQKQIAIRTEALTAQMELELAKQRAENDAIIARCNAKANATVKGIEIEAKRNHTLIEAKTQQEAQNMKTAAEAKRILDVGEANAKVGDMIGKSQGGQEIAVLEKQSEIAKQLGKGAVYTQMGLPVLGFRAQIPQCPQSSLSDTTKQ